LINEALFLDLRKSLFEAQAAELIWLQNDIIYVTRNLHKWVRDEKVEDIDMIWKLTAPKVRKDPLGCVLVIG
jgi:beta-apo-4'-carotenal oxygenase